MQTVKQMLDKCYFEGVGWYPVPDWAEDYNYDLQPVERAQLYTLNGRRTGNAVIGKVWHSEHGETYEVVTDIGNHLILTTSELTSMFEIGIFIVKEEGIQRRLGKQQHEPA